MRVLIVEDHPDLAYLLTEMLAAEGFDVDTCSRDFDQRLLDPRVWEDIDAVLFDLWLSRPSLDGSPDSLPYIRSARRSKPAIRICIFSAADARHLSCADELFDLADAALIKGAHLEDIVEAIRG